MVDCLGSSWGARTGPAEGETCPPAAGTSTGDSIATHTIAIEIEREDGELYSGTCASAASASGEVQNRLPTCGEDLATKLVLNCISTLAHVVKGCVFGNRMINLSVTNMKLFGRASDLAASLAGCSSDAASRCLVRAIHEIDEDEASMGQVIAGSDRAQDAVASLALQAALALPVAEHVSAAAKKQLIVPTATVLASAGASGHYLTVAAARAVLSSASSLREAIAGVAAHS